MEISNTFQEYKNLENYISDFSIVEDPKRIDGFISFIGDSQKFIVQVK